MKTKLLSILLLAAMVVSVQADQTWTKSGTKYLGADGAWTVLKGKQNAIKFNAPDDTKAAAAGWVIDMAPLGELYSETWFSQFQPNADWPTTARQNLKKVVFPKQCTTLLSSAFGSSAKGAFLGLNEVVGTGVTSVATLAFQACSNLVSVVLSPDLAALNVGNTGNAYWGTFTGCVSLENFQPSTFSSAFTSFGIGCFRGCALTNFFDLSATSIATIPAMCFYGNPVAGITLPATLTTIEERAFAEIPTGTTFRFLGDVPAFNGTGYQKPFYLSNHSNQPGYRHTFIVDAKTYPAWTTNADPSDPTFVAVADLQTCGSGNVRNNFHTTDADFPGKHTLGVTRLGGNQGWSWLVQYAEEEPTETIYMMFE